MVNEEVRSRWEVAVEILHLLDEEDLLPNELNKKLIGLFEVTDGELELEYSSGQRIFVDSDIGHAKRELKEAGLIDYGDGRVRPARITALGRAVLAENPSVIDAEFLKPFKAKMSTSSFSLTVDVVSVKPLPKSVIVEFALTGLESHGKSVFVEIPVRVGDQNIPQAIREAKYILLMKGEFLVESLVNLDLSRWGQ